MDVDIGIFNIGQETKYLIKEFCHDIIKIISIEICKYQPKSNIVVIY